MHINRYSNCISTRYFRYAWKHRSSAKSCRTWSWYKGSTSTTLFKSAIFWAFSSQLWSSSEWMGHSSNTSVDWNSKIAQTAISSLQKCSSNCSTLVCCSHSASTAILTRRRNLSVRWTIFWQSRWNNPMRSPSLLHILYIISTPCLASTRNVNSWSRNWPSIPQPASKTMTSW